MLDVHSTASSALEVKAYRGGLEAIEALAPEWRGLCEEGPANFPFYRPEWFSAFVQAFNPQAKLQILAVRRGSRLRAVLPLIHEHRGFLGIPCRILRSPTNVHSNRFDICLGGGEGPEVLQAIWQFLAQDHSWDVLQLEDVPENGAARQLLPLSIEAGYPSGLWASMRTPYIPLAETSLPVEKALGREQSSFFSTLRKKMRKLEKSGPVSVQKVTTADPSMLEAFYAMEAAGWKGKEGTAIACDPQTKDFYTRVAQAASQFGYFDLRVVSCGSEKVAINYAFTLAGRHLIPKTTYAEKFSQSSPGQIIMYRVIEQCVNEGVSEMDFLGPWASWKGHWTDAVREHSHCFVFRKGALGWLLWLLKFQGAARARKLKRGWVSLLESRKQRAKAAAKPKEGIPSKPASE